MASQSMWSLVVAVLIVLTSILLTRLLRSSSVTKINTLVPADLTTFSSEAIRLSEQLAAKLPGSVILPTDGQRFKESLSVYWAQQECEVVPSCVLRPRTVKELSAAITMLKHEYDERRKQNSRTYPEGLFAVRGGGHSPIPGAASIKGGVLIDLSLFCKVELADDNASVAIGAGARWMDVSKTLDGKGLAVVGGRNSAVGVGGLTLGGGLSFFSPRFGLVCNNIVSYEVVLASGIVTTASASTNPDLWRALKGGSNNFGIVTCFTARSFPASKIWSGFLYMPASQTTKALAAFHEFVNRANSEIPGTSYDSYAAGPIACWSYIHPLRIEAISINLVYTKPLENDTRWPACWQSSGFPKLWRLWNTCKTRSLTSATDEMNALNPPGRRQVFANTTVENDHETLIAAHAAYHNAIAGLRKANVKGLVWTLVMQPLLPEWARKGDSNPLGLHNCPDTPLVIVSFTVNWDLNQHDLLVKSTLRSVIENIEAVAVTRKTGHGYKYLNYCANWQKPFKGYGKENWLFLRETSRKYDPDGLFQHGCLGGFKLELD